MWFLRISNLKPFFIEGRWHQWTLLNQLCSVCLYHKLGLRRQCDSSIKYVEHQNQCKKSVVLVKCFWLQCSEVFFHLSYSISVNLWYDFFSTRYLSKNISALNFTCIQKTLEEGLVVKFSKTKSFTFPNLI